MFERLTERDEYGNTDIVGVESADLQLNLEFDEFNKVTNALNRLAEYEDSGLSPEEVHKLVKVLKQARESLQAAWEDDGSTTVGKQMLEIIKAIDAFLKRCSFAE